jgi:hypothetical protein
MRVYVYALVEQPMRKVCLRGRNLETLGVGDVFAIIERASTPPPLSEAVLVAQHAIVAALTRRFDAILPARVGAFVDLSELERLVLSRSATLHDAFELVRGREQMTVRVFGPLRRAGPTADKPVSGTQYLVRRVHATGAEPAAVRVRASVERLIAAERVERGRGILRVALHHLVRRGMGPRYRQLAGRAIAQLPATMTVRVSGPWAPFAFAPSLWP